MLVFISFFIKYLCSDKYLKYYFTCSIIMCNMKTGVWKRNNEQETERRICTQNKLLQMNIIKIFMNHGHGDINFFFLLFSEVLD